MKRAVFAFALLLLGSVAHADFIAGHGSAHCASDADIWDAKRECCHASGERCTKGQGVLTGSSGTCVREGDYNRCCSSDGCITVSPGTGGASSGEAAASTGRTITVNAAPATAVSGGVGGSVGWGGASSMRGADVHCTYDDAFPFWDAKHQCCHASGERCTKGQNALLGASGTCYQDNGHTVCVSTGVGGNGGNGGNGGVVAGSIGGALTINTARGNAGAITLGSDNPHCVGGCAGFIAGAESPGGDGTVTLHHSFDLDLGDADRAVRIHGKATLNGSPILTESDIKISHSVAVAIVLSITFVSAMAGVITASLFVAGWSRFLLRRRAARLRVYRERQPKPAGGPFRGSQGTSGPTFKPGKGGAL